MQVEKRMQGEKNAGEKNARMKRPQFENPIAARVVPNVAVLRKESSGRKQSQPNVFSLGLFFTLPLVFQQSVT